MLRIIFIIISNILLSNFLLSQNLQNLGLNNKDQIMRLPEGFVIESEIDPEKYILGPGDKIGLSIITSAKMAYVLTINPTGDLWIPDIGSIHISGININSAKQKVSEYIQNYRFKSAEVVLVILNIRHYKVQIVGAVLRPGFITVSSIDRLSDVIAKGGGLHKQADEENILISSILGQEIYFNLKEFQLNGKLSNNPVLKEGDVVEISYIDMNDGDILSAITYNNNFVFVSGFVLRPSGHRFIPGYTINDYISLSGGVIDFGDKKNINIYRNGEKITLDDKYSLRPGDDINIPANIKYRMLGNMSALQTLTAMMTLFLTYQAATN